MIAIDLTTQRRRPSSGAFQPDSDGVSVYRKSRLEAAHLTVGDLKRAPQKLVVSLGVGEIRTITQLGVHDDAGRHARTIPHTLATVHTLSSSVGRASAETSDDNGNRRSLAFRPCDSYPDCRLAAPRRLTCRYKWVWTGVYTGHF